LRNEADWAETKFSRNRHGEWRSNRAEVAASSRTVTDCMAGAYQRAITAYAKGRLADLGCGKVPLYGMYRERVKEVVCVDWPESLHGSMHVDSFADLNAPLELTPDSFDTVVATDVIEHLHAPSVFFESAARMLKPGGHFIVGVPFLYWVHEAPHDYYRYTRFALERLSRDAGLSVVHLSPYGGPAEVLCDLFAKTVGRALRLAAPIYWLSRGLLALPPVRKLSRAASETVPLGYVLVARKETSGEIGAAATPP
jgi:SAM-dependent methyltransferase